VITAIFTLRYIGQKWIPTKVWKTILGFSMFVMVKNHCIRQKHFA